MRVKVEKVQYACVDCGTLSLWATPSKFKQPEEKYGCHRCAMKKAGTRTEVKQRRSESQKKYHHEHPEASKRRSESARIQWARTGEKERHSELQKISLNRPEVKQHMSDGQKKYRENMTPEDKQKVSDVQKIAMNRPEVKQRNSDAQKIAQNRPEVKHRRSEALKIAFARPEVKQKMSVSRKKHFETPNNYERILIHNSRQGFWYGHPILSAISEVTRWETPSKRQLSRHHVYWQEKACCVWDEDAQGYYAMIDLNHNKNNPNWYKHYIKGDPNKFVLLTAKEHGEVKGSKKSGKDTMWWVRYFEDLIEKREAEGKKCYLSPEEYEIYKVDHADTIAYYTQKIPKVEVAAVVPEVIVEIEIFIS
jgi:rRNA maturation protein Nop10